METFVATHEALIRLGSFVGVLAVMGLWETFGARRVPQVSRWLRWANNLALTATGALLLRLVFPAAAVGVAALAKDHGWGLFNLLAAPAWVAIAGSLLLLDLAIWLQHVMFHAVPALWRLHRVHHADPDFDVTTGVRFHPLEILLSMLIKFMVVVLVGPPLAAVVLFEVVLNASSMFNHGNVRLPASVDRRLRWVVVTPDMHRVHHSVEDDEANSNFGFSLSWWDRLFGTYRAQPRAGHEHMVVGIRGWHAARDVTWLPGLLAIPFHGGISGYTINRRAWGGKPDGMPASPNSQVASVAAPGVSRAGPNISPAGQRLAGK